MWKSSGKVAVSNVSTVWWISATGWAFTQKCLLFSNFFLWQLFQCKTWSVSHFNLHLHHTETIQLWAWWQNFTLTLILNILSIYQGVGIKILSIYICVCVCYIFKVGVHYWIALYTAKKLLSICISLKLFSNVLEVKSTLR